MGSPSWTERISRFPSSAEILRGRASTYRPMGAPRLSAKDGVLPRLADIDKARLPRFGG